MANIKKARLVAMVEELHKRTFSGCQRNYTGDEN